MASNVGADVIHNSRYALRVPVGYSAEQSQYRDQLYRLANWLQTLTSTCKPIQRGRWINYGRDQYRSMFGSAGASVVAAALETGLIDRLHAYKTESYPKALRLRDEHRDGQWREVELRRKPRAKNAQHSPPDPLLNELLSHIRTFGLPEVTDATGWDGYLVRSIADGICHISRDGFGHRVHHTLTGLSRLKRRELRANNVSHRVLSPEGDSAAGTDTLVEIDLRVAQPLLIGVMARDWCLHVGRDASDVLKWIGECERDDGDIYQMLADEVGSEDFGRAQAKKMMMMAHYAQRRVVQHCKLAQAERRLFPGIYAYLASLREVNYRATSQAAQRMESHLMIDGVSCRLLRDHPELRFFTIHDAIVCSSTDADTVRSVIYAVFEPYGVRPALKTTPLSEIDTTPRQRPHYLHTSGQ